jgi:NADPH-ferrihemoprotein reductase
LASIGREVGTSLLFFGCRGPYDFIYSSELGALGGGDGGIEVVTAFSRAAGEKVYVQERIEERGEEVVRLLVEEGAYLYICGGAGMARDVAACLGGLVQRRMGWGEEGVREWREGVRRGRRWQEDVWG